MKFTYGYLIATICFLSINALAQTTTPGTITGTDGYHVITTAVPFLGITPDARHAALGDAGVATSPDANSAYWNAGKLAFIDKKYGGSISVTPWLSKIINDMWIFQGTGFYKINREQAIAVGMKYFDLGEIFLRGDNNQDNGSFNPREFAFDFTYSRMLTENLSVGITGRYIHSNLTGTFSSNNTNDARPASTAAADIGVYYTKPLQGARASSISLGANASNIGGKISYSNNSNKDFLPTNLRIGGVYTTELDPYNSFSFILDFNKLMVPTIDKGQTVLSGMFGSFSDAPGGAREELHEVITNMGVEYWYNKTFAARAGYFLEAKDKGNRKYMTIGLGFRSQKAFGIDVAYLVPTNKRETPLAETLRFSILFHINQKTVEEESVTD
ncbi:MAG TPA: type IX secretion system outer membrane channel protein PorV [Cyclobacteriaceae bacterium]|nr:type IX secretion system outer membrane channel protein PorV [Cyclobacteriaceae bacterium]